MGPLLYVNSERTASSRRKAYTRTPTYPCAFACTHSRTRSRMHSERRNMYACIRERKESTRVKTRGQYDVAKARRGCRRVPTRRERKTGTNGLSIKENAIDGEGKGDRARILGVSHRCPVYREAKERQKESEEEKAKTERTNGL